MNRDVHPHLEKEEGGVMVNAEEANKYLLKVKFPANGPQFEEEVEPQLEEDFSLEVTKEEVTGALKRSRNRSSPELDGVNYKALKICNKRHPGLLPRMYTEFLRHQTFPKV